MIHVARQGRWQGMGRLLLRATARDLRALVVPGPDVAAASGLELAAAGLRLAATPRHANLLLLVGELPGTLGDAALVLYAQMMRPRVCLLLGSAAPAALPISARAELSQTGLLEGVERLRECLSTQAYQKRVDTFSAPILSPSDSSQEENSDAAGDSGHHQMEHGDEGDGGMSFMSMVKVTKDLPRSPDGLPMDRIEVPFGPVFPGLPGGLSLTFTLDGDSVAQVKSETLRTTCLRTPQAGFLPDALLQAVCALDPLTPVSYRLLALRALTALGAPAQTPGAHGDVALLERERTVSHLGWLALLGRQIGFAWLQRRALRLQLACLRSEMADFPTLGKTLRRFDKQVRRNPLLRARLSGLGVIAPQAGLRGPVARACGLSTDARTGDPAYLDLAFEPRRGEGSDALQRLYLRLDELHQSVALVAAVLSRQRPVEHVSPAGRQPELSDGEAMASVETPRGEARLQLMSSGGRITAVEIDTPSRALLGQLPSLLRQQELGDALTCVCSLDLSPWDSAT